jgi:hypothetical protein
MSHECEHPKGPWGLSIVVDILSPTIIISPRNSTRIAVPGVAWDGMNPNDAGGPDVGGRKIQVAYRRRIPRKLPIPQILGTSNQRPWQPTQSINAGLVHCRLWRRKKKFQKRSQFNLSLSHLHRVRFRRPRRRHGPNSWSIGTSFGNAT